MNASHKHFADIDAALQRYKSTYRREGLPDWEWGGLQALFQDEHRGDAELIWHDPWPHGQRAGVYFVFARDMHLLYIGKASMSSSLGARLSKWFQGPTEGSCRVVGTWSNHPFFVKTLAVPDVMRFEAPALEEFLIAELSPPDNGVGIIQAVEVVAATLSSIEPPAATLW